MVLGSQMALTPPPKSIKSGIKKNIENCHQKDLQNKPVLAWEREARKSKKKLRSDCQQCGMFPNTSNTFVEYLRYYCQMHTNV